MRNVLKNGYPDKSDSLFFWNKKIETWNYDDKNLQTNKYMQPNKNL